MHDVRGRAVPEGEYVYVAISGKARVPVLHSKNLRKLKVDCSARLYSNRH